MTAHCARFTGRLLVAAALALGLASFAVAQAPTKFKIIFSSTPTTFELPHFVAMELGWLDKAGIKVEEVYVSGDPNAIRGLISDNSDSVVTASAGLLAAQQAVIQGAQIKVIASWQPRVDYQMFVQERIKSIKDLATAKIGVAAVGGMTHRLPEMLMRKYSVDPSKATFIAIGGHDARMKAVITDKTDASVVGMMFAAQGLESNRGSKVLSSIVNDFPDIGYTYLIARDKDLADPAKKKAMETYIRLAVVEASRFIMKNPQKAAEIMQSRVKDVPLPLIVDVIKQMNKLDLWGVNGGMQPEIITYTSQLGFDTQSLTRVMRPNEGIDNSLVDAVLKEVGRQ